MLDESGRLNCHCCLVVLTSDIAVEIVARGKKKIMAIPCAAYLVRDRDLGFSAMRDGSVVM